MLLLLINQNLLKNAPNSLLGLEKVFMEKVFISGVETYTSIRLVNWIRNMIFHFIIKYCF